MINKFRFDRGMGRRLVAVLVVAPVWISGCGSGREVETGLVPVQGRVTLDGGPWPKPGQITFVPVKGGGDASAASRSAPAAFSPDGSFEVVGGYGESRGLHPGDYWVAVECLEAEPDMPLPGQNPEPPKSYAPPRYQNPETSGLTFKVESGASSAEANFDVKSK